MRAFILTVMVLTTPACGTMKHMVKAIEQDADARRHGTERLFEKIDHWLDRLGLIAEQVGMALVKALGILITLLLLRRARHIASLSKRGLGWLRSRWPFWRSRGSGCGD